MPKARFRIDSAIVEGFKGFTEAQTITFGSKHAFLFGKNGSGKSSVVEAVRWCLFGLADRPDTEVLNPYYEPGECQVDLALQSSEGMWHIRRRLRPGAEKSRATITNPQGQEVLQQQVFPYLARMGPKEGAHVIFAAQQATSRRPQADVSDFHKVLYSYLHLEDVPELLERLDKVLEEQSSAREDAASEIGEIEDGLRDRLAKIALSLKELLRNPPWVQGAPPTQADTENAVLTFAVEVAELANETLPAGISSGEALDKVDQLCQKLANADVEEQRKQLISQRVKGAALRTQLQSFTKAEGDREEAVVNIAGIEKKIKEALAGKSLEALEQDINLIKQRIDESGARLAIAKSVEEFCASYSPNECPACGAKCDSNGLQDKVKLGQGTPAQASLVNELNGLQDVYKKTIELAGELKLLKKSVQTAEEDCNSAIANIRTLLGLPSDSSPGRQDIEARLSSIDNSVQTLEENLKSAESHHAERKKRVEALHGELRFHKYRDEQQKIQLQLKAGLEPTRERLVEVIELENTTQEIREALGQAFNEAIDRALPQLDELMTSVYQRLTGQKSFEKVHIKRADGNGRNLKVLVGSERIQEQLFDPEDVLNGQSNNALQLVPYFVFSQFQAESLELNLLFIDDPSQSFDTSHIDFLLQELADAGSHAQLVIATHEEAQFRPQIANFFKSEEYELMTFSEFDVKKGPTFAVE